MGFYPPSRPVTLLEAASANSSTYTSEALLVVDYPHAQSISVITADTGASRFTLQGTLEDGFAAAIDTDSWSDLTVITAGGLYTVDPGVRWVRMLRSALESTSTVRYGGA